MVKRSRTGWFFLNPFSASTSAKLTFLSLRSRRSGRGVAFSMDQAIGNNVVSFLRYAYSEGKVKPTRQSIATGFGLKNPFNRKDDLLGFFKRKWGSALVLW